MKKLLLALFALFAFPVHATDTAEFAKLIKPKIDYAADQTFSGRDGKSFTSRINHTADKERREMAHGQSNMVSILRWDRKLMWNLMPAQNMYMEISLDPEALKKSPMSHPTQDPTEDWKKSEVTIAKQGADTISGVATTRYDVLVKEQGGQTRRSLFWVSDDGIVMQMQGFPDPKATAPEFQMTLSNLKPGPQAPVLFEVPAGYSKLDMGGMMKMQMPPAN